MPEHLWLADPLTVTIRMIQCPDCAGEGFDLGSLRQPEICQSCAGYGDILHPLRPPEPSRNNFKLLYSFRPEPWKVIEAAQSPDLFLNQFGIGNHVMLHSMRDRKQAKPRKRKVGRKSLEEMHREFFVAPPTISRRTGVLTMYKSIPSVTTYGAYEKPI